MDVSVCSSREREGPEDESPFMHTGVSLVSPCWFSSFYTPLFYLRVSRTYRRLQQLVVLPRLSPEEGDTLLLVVLSLFLPLVIAGVFASSTGEGGEGSGT